jgi:cytochrome P450
MVEEILMALDFTNRAFINNPYDTYRDLRQHQPMATVDLPRFKGALMLMRYDDVVSLLKDSRFTNERRKVSGKRDWMNSWWTPSMIRAFFNTMALVDDPDHARLKTLVHKAFTPRMIQQMESRIEQISHDLLDKAESKSKIDLIADFALPLPLTVISELMGVPEADRLRFRRLLSKFMDSITTSSAMSMLSMFTSAYSLNRFLRYLIELKRKQPQDDMMTYLVQAEEQGDKLSEDEIVAMIFLLLLAGHETTVNLIGNGTLALLEHSDQLRKLTSDLSLVDTAVEEMLRFTSPVQHVAQRYALEDLELNGHRITRGTMVLVNIGSANRDEAIFPNADQFDITRNPNRHIAFGMGIHYCLGAPLARMEGQVAFTALLSRFPNIRFAGEEPHWRDGLVLRGLKSLPIHLD